MPQMCVRPSTLPKDTILPMGIGLLLMLRWR
jgi:hypothetical protein